MSSSRLILDSKVRHLQLKPIDVTSKSYLAHDALKLIVFPSYFIVLIAAVKDNGNLVPDYTYVEYLVPVNFGADQS